MIGSFYQPDLVVSDMNILASLPEREIICGYAEILKSSIIDNLNNFLYLDKNLNKILKLKGDNFIIDENTCSIYFENLIKSKI